MNWLKALRAGSRLSNAAAWKNSQTAINSVMALLTVLLSMFGDKLPVSNEQMLAIAGAIVAIVNIYITNSTSKKVGV